MTSPDTFETLGESKDFIEHKLRSCALSPSTCRGFFKNPWSYTQSTGPNTSFRPCLALGTWNPTLYPSYHTPAARLQALSQEVQAPLGQKLQIREATASRPSHRHRWMVDANAIIPFSIIQKRFCFRVAWMDSAKSRVSHLPRVLHRVIWLWLIKMVGNTGTAQRAMATKSVAPKLGSPIEQWFPNEESTPGGLHAFSAPLWYERNDTEL